MTDDDAAFTEELLALNQRLLESIVKADWKTYAALCDSSLTAFEPEARGNLVAGMDFHRFYFDLGVGDGPLCVTMASPTVRRLGDDAAVVAYVRLVQKRDAAGQPVTATHEETRVWRRIDGQWKHVHFHRSMPS